MGDRGEDMQQMTTGRNRTRVAAIRVRVYGGCSLSPVSHRGDPPGSNLGSHLVLSASGVGELNTCESLVLLRLDTEESTQ